MVPEMPLHVVQQGEHLASIAEKYGFVDYRTIWDHAQNRELKQKRQDPNILFPGDEVFIPDRNPKEYEGETEQRHTFQVKKRPLKLRLVLRDFTNQPLAQAQCELQVAGASHALTADGDGKIEQTIPPSAADATLTVRDSNGQIVMHLGLRIGSLDPIEESTGWRARLNNLGYDAGPIGQEDDRKLRSAIEAFQRENRLHIDGDCGPQTQAKLKEAHGC
jgi:N-acetylmuramoyl-L-alanine amidase